MPEVQGSELTRPVEQTRGERLTDEQLGNLISAVGNNPAKAITLLAMANGNIYPASDLLRVLLACQEKYIGWRMSQQTLFSYCTNSLAPIGLVARETLNPDLSTYGYQITHYGNNAGIPFCGLMLDWSTKHDIDLNRFWGSTSSSSPVKQAVDMSTGEEFEFKKRSPITTLQILYELITAPDLPIREVDLINRLGESTSQVISRNLQRLAAANVIEYQATKVNKAISAYKLTSSPPLGELPIYKHYTSLTQAVWSVCKQYPTSYLSIKGVSKLMPQAIKERMSQISLVTRVSTVLAHLKQHNYLENEKFHSGFQSEINLSEDQRIILTELLEILGRFQNQDPEIMAKGKRIAEEIINHPSRVSDILRKAKERSSNANQSPFLETMDLIKCLISSHPGATNRELQRLLEQEGKKLGIQQISALTIALKKGDSIRTINEGIVKKFFPKESPDQPK